jgi:hypothetical protein
MTRTATAMGLNEQTGDLTNHRIGGRKSPWATICLVMPVPIAAVRRIVGIQVPERPIPVPVTVGAAIGAASHWRLAACRWTALRHRKQSSTREHPNQKRESLQGSHLRTLFTARLTQTSDDSPHCQAHCLIQIISRFPFSWVWHERVFAASDACPLYPLKADIVSKLGSFCNPRNRYPNNGQSRSNTFRQRCTPRSRSN